MCAADQLLTIGAYLFHIVRSILFQVDWPSDLEVGLAIQVCGLDEAHLQNYSTTAASHSTWVI